MIELTFAGLLGHARSMKDLGTPRQERRVFLSGMRIGARFYTCKQYKINLGNGKVVKV